jgi:methylated-DNA-protein-cysteine methyltransferase-like protein
MRELLTDRQKILATGKGRGLSAKRQRSSIIECIHQIPRGTVATYGAVARATGVRGGPRLVAAVLRNFSAGVPWHRVVGAGGQIKLVRHEGAEQRRLLKGEGVQFRGERVLMERHEHHGGVKG